MPGRVDNPSPSGPNTPPRTSSRSPARPTASVQNGTNAVTNGTNGVANGTHGVSGPTSVSSRSIDLCEICLCPWCRGQSNGIQNNGGSRTASQTNGTDVARPSGLHDYTGQLASLLAAPDTGRRGRNPTTRRSRSPHSNGTTSGQNGGTGGQNGDCHRSRTPPRNGTGTR